MKNNKNTGKKKRMVTLIKYIVLLFIVFGIVDNLTHDSNLALGVALAAIALILIISKVLKRRKDKAPKMQNTDVETISVGADMSMESFGIYAPTYVFSTVDGYKDKLKSIREAQASLIKNKTACTVPTNFTFNNSQAEGTRVVNDWVKLMLRAFNGECDVIIDRVSYTNFESSKQRIEKSAESISAIGKRMQISINRKYIDLKQQELVVAYDYQQFKQAEKERIRQIREEEREKAKLEKELADRRAKIAKDQSHVQNEIDSLTTRIEAADEAEKEALQARVHELEQHRAKLDDDMQQVALREQQAKAGYVYVISNIGSFGENVYKIGMTRRLEPQERVDELGDASVPFRFDVHAFIFSEDAVGLETALHNAFASKRVNMVNPRKEFFNVTLNEIEDCVKHNYDGTAEFTQTAVAQEYRETLQMRKSA